jgi:hypothetical protein
VAYEVSRLLPLIFQQHRKSGSLDLEAIEMALRSALHHVGAVALGQWLQCEPPGPEERKQPCPCGQVAVYRELRSRTILSAVGEIEIRRPYFLCSHCHHGQFPFDRQLDLAHQDLSPGVRRMLSVVGAEAPFDHGRQQMQLLAGLTVTTKAVERTAEALGEDISTRQQQQIQQAMQLDLRNGVHSR